MGTDLRVGVIDSGCSPEQASALLGARRFWLEDGQLREGEMLPDQLGHGSAVLAGLQREAGPVPVLLARCSAPGQHQRLAGGGRAAVAGGGGGYAGQPQPWPAAGPACVAPGLRRGFGAGVLLCASSPARGGPVYPANYPGVIRVTGDARCAPGQWSWLGSRQADFGGYVGTGDRAGASWGARP